MTSLPSATENAPLLKRSLGAVLRQDWPWYVPGALLCFLLASIVFHGWPQGLRPDLHYPLIYADDGLSHSWLIKRVMEGWIFNNPRSGYPFGSEFLDYPGADTGHYVVIKLLSLFSGEYQAVLNLYLLLGFVPTFITAFCVLRACGLRLPFALAAAALFDFLPFHFQRLPHIFFTWYFVAPLFFYLGFKLLDGKLFAPVDGAGHWTRWRWLALLPLLGCFGVYYALFGMIIMSTAALTAAVRRSHAFALRAGALACGLVLAGAVLNITPNLLHRYQHGANSEVGHRWKNEGEIYGLRLTQLLLPRADHRVKLLNKAAESYNSTAPLVNENMTASLGLVGAAGLLALFGVIALALAGRRQPVRLTVLALLVGVLFLFGTMGGLGSLFSYLITSSVRGWNRISVYIGFGVLLALFLLLQAALEKRWQGRRLAWGAGILAALLGVFGLLDQSSKPCRPCIASRHEGFDFSRDFIARIEAALPPGSAVYQLPYMPFPEVPPLHRLGAYEHAAAFLHSKTLRWNYAGSKGRAGDLFYRGLAQEPLAVQLDILRKLGFAGIYIDRRGYADEGRAVIAELTALTGAPAQFTRADQHVQFFRLPGAQAVPGIDRLSAQDIMLRVGYQYDHLGKRVHAQLSDGVDFAQPHLPDFIKDMRGLSAPEGWGRWSDAGLARSVVLELNQTLPQQFTLMIRADAFGPNRGGELEVRVGSQVRRVELKPGMTEYRLPIKLLGEQASRIELSPQRPISPRDLFGAPDDRRLGIGLSMVKIEP